MNSARIAFALTILFCANAALAGERRYSVSDFDKIRVVGAAGVTVETGRATTVRATGDREAIEALSVEVQDRVLTVQPLGGIFNPETKRAKSTAILFVTLPQLSGAKLNGSGSIKAAMLRGAQADVSLTGSGQITIARVLVDRLTVRLSGAGTMTLAGKALNVDASIKGAGNLAASALDTADLKLMAASSGLISMSAKRSATVTATGSGTVAIIGGPSCTVQNLGVGTVNCGKKP